jgi:hypothetical protein
MISRAALSTVVQGQPKYRSMLAGNAAFFPSDFESIATVTASSGATSLTFSSIPSTYKHLEIRGIARDTIALDGGVGIKMRFNGDSGANYVRHSLRGDGTNAVTGANTGFNELAFVGGSIGDSSTASAFGASVISIFDYASTVKNKTIRGLSGSEANTSSANFYIVLNSGLWLNTAAITSITLLPGQTAFVAGSKFGLFGIKG